LTTGSGLIFVGASADYYFRAFATDTGESLWEYRLPTGANATPMSYEHEGKQYVAVAVGGHSGLGTRRHDAFMVFSLPGK
jgi:quinoprotein glucose dehydrogenase